MCVCVRVRVRVMVPVLVLVRVMLRVRVMVPVPVVCVKTSTHLQGVEVCLHEGQGSLQVVLQGLTVLRGDLQVSHTAWHPRSPTVTHSPQIHSYHTGHGTQGPHVCILCSLFICAEEASRPKRPTVINTTG